MNLFSNISKFPISSCGDKSIWTNVIWTRQNAYMFLNTASRIWLWPYQCFLIYEYLNKCSLGKYPVDKYGVAVVVVHRVKGKTVILPSPVIYTFISPWGFSGTPRCNTFLTGDSKSLVPFITLRKCRPHVIIWIFFLSSLHNFLDLIEYYLLFISFLIQFFPCSALPVC